MNIKREYAKISRKLIQGYSGWSCPCCNPYGCSPRNMKRRANRLYRRKCKQDKNLE